MKKETIFAIFLGIAFGVVLSFVMISRTKSNQFGKTKPLTNEKKAPQTVAADVETQSFTISEPQDKQIISSNSVTVKGVASKGDLLIIQSPIKDIAYKLDSDSFQVKIPLALGENVVNLTVYPSNVKGRTQEKQLRVYYLDEQ
jgi:hypothetical protein